MGIVARSLTAIVIAALVSSCSCSTPAFATTDGSIRDARARPDRVLVPLDGSNAPSVHVQNARGLVIELITSSCAGDCADVVAVARGGSPPYHYRWEDGSTDPARHVCLDRSGSIEVEATDTADAEFNPVAQTASAVVTVDVLECHDGGGSNGPAFCIDNPSFEGRPGLAVGLHAGEFCPAVGIVPTGFTTCSCTPDTLPAAGGPPLAAAHGATYLGIGGGGAGTAKETVSSPLCAALVPGTAYPFSIQLADTEFSYQGQAPVPGGRMPVLQIWGGSSPCDASELLWQSPHLTNINEWGRYCGVLAPTAAHTHLTLVPLIPPDVDTMGPSSIAYVTVDAFVPGEICIDP